MPMNEGQQSDQASKVQQVPQQSKLWNYILLMLRLAVNIFASTLIWFNIYAILVFTPLSRDFDYSTQILIFDLILPQVFILLGILTGLWYFIRERKRENISESQVSPEKDKKTRDATRKFNIYLFFATLLISAISWGVVNDGERFIGEFLVVPAFFIFIFLNIPCITFFIIRGFFLKSNPNQATFVPLSHAEKYIIYVAAVAAVIGFGAHIYILAEPLPDPTQTTSIDEVIATPERFDNTNIYSTISLAFGIKGQSGFAVGAISDTEMPARDDSTTTSYIWIQPEALKFYIADNANWKLGTLPDYAQSCVHPTDIAQSNLSSGFTQQKIEDSEAAFAAQYHVSVSDVLLYSCDQFYQIVGIFHNSVGGPQNLFSGQITAPIDGRDYNSVLKEMHTDDSHATGYGLSPDPLALPVQ
jgi:hypothetical protein